MKALAHFPILSYFECGEESKFLLTFGNMLPSEHYARETQTMIPQLPVHPPGKNLSQPADVKGGVTEMAKAPNDGTSQTTGTTVR